MIALFSEPRRHCPSPDRLQRRCGSPIFHPVGTLRSLFEKRAGARVTRIGKNLVLLSVPVATLDEASAARLTDAEKAAIQTLLQTASVQQLPSFFEEGRPGGWIRERVKDTALEWLDVHALSPPSMRHINRNKATRLYNTRNAGHTVIIEPEIE